MEKGVDLEQEVGVFPEEKPTTKPRSGFNDLSRPSLDDEGPGEDVPLRVAGDPGEPLSLEEKRVEPCGSHVFFEAVFAQDGLAALVDEIVPGGVEIGRRVRLARSPAFFDPQPVFSGKEPLPDLRGRGGENIEMRAHVTSEGARGNSRVLPSSEQNGF